MYDYVKDKAFLREMKKQCADIVNQLVMEINKDDCLTVRAYLVGSGAKNLITQNAQEPIDLDYNLEITAFRTIFQNDGRKLSQYLQRMFNTVLCRNGWGDCKDSTSVFTTCYRHIPGKNKTAFKIDLAVVRQDGYGTYRFIHEKHGNINLDRFHWDLAPDSRGLAERVEKLKKENLWEAVRETYLTKKNLYLIRQESGNHPSYNVYVEAVNEIYNANFGNFIPLNLLSVGAFKPTNMTRSF